MEIKDREASPGLLIFLYRLVFFLSGVCSGGSKTIRRDAGNHTIQASSVFLSSAQGRKERSEGPRKVEIRRERRYNCEVLLLCTSYHQEWRKGSELLF